MNQPHPDSFASSKKPDISVPTLIIGGGVAGFSAALEAADHGPVLVVTKDCIRESNTAYAQGGVAAVFSEGDSLESHISDTLATGQGLCHEEAVRAVINEGPERIREMLEMGARFDQEDGELHLTREGGHSHRRILHANGDATGREFVRTLVNEVKEHDNIELSEFTFALDLLLHDGRCVGVQVMDRDGGVRNIAAACTILCTGGSGMVFRESTNPDIATGDGVAMAYRAGAKIHDIEFFQFHPTTLYVAGAARHLITEAVRGEGGHLVDGRGERFLFQYHESGELAPRDIVSRATIQHLALSEEPCVYLDLRHLGPQVVERFPGFHQTCQLYNLDITKDRIPAHPSAHYMVGGVATDLHGRTSIPGLYAAGEVAASGLHGANRLASNSLLEGLVFGRRAAMASAEQPLPIPEEVPVIHRNRPLPHSILNLNDMRNSIQSLMWRWVGITRHGSDLKRALEQIQTWHAYVRQVAFDSTTGWEVENILTTAWLVIRGGIWREESRGTHFRADHPEPRDAFKRHSVQRLGEDVFGKPLR